MSDEIRLNHVLNMSDLGDKLREARERRNLTIGQVQKQTHIHQTVLKALEDGNCDSILNPTYVKSFLKKYSDYLGLDPIGILREYKRFHPGPESLAINKLPEMETPSKDLSGLVQAIKFSIIAVVVIVLAAFTIGRAISYFKKPVMLRRLEVLKAKHSDTLSSKVAKKTSAAKSNASTRNAAIVIPKSVQLKLLLKVNSNVLIKMKADGVLLFERVLPKGTAEMFTADNMINIFAANGEAIELVLNGKGLGSPGKGVLKNIEITRSGVRVR